MASLCHFVFSPRNNAKRKDEKTKWRHAKRRNNARRKDEQTKHATRKDDKLTDLNGVFSCGVVSAFLARIETFRVADFVVSSFRMALFRLFVFFAWRLFIFLRGVKDEKAKWHKPATIRMGLLLYHVQSLWWFWILFNRSDISFQCLSCMFPLLPKHYK